MSCIATLYTLPSSLDTAFREAKANEKREMTTKFLFATKRKTVGEKYLWEFLDEVCEKKDELNYSGFFVVDYMTYLELDEDHFFQPVDDYFMKLSHEGAKELAAFLEAHPPDKTRLEEFWKNENDDAVSDLEEVIDTFVDVHNTIHKWASEINVSKFGVLFLSF